MYVYYISHSINYVVHITIYLYAIQFKNYPAALHKMHKYEMPTSQNSFKKMISWSLYQMQKYIEIQPPLDPNNT